MNRIFTLCFASILMVSTSTQAKVLTVMSGDKEVEDGAEIALDCDIQELDYGTMKFTEYKWDPELTVKASKSVSGSVTLSAEADGWQLCWPSQCQMAQPGASVTGNGRFGLVASDLKIHCGFTDSGAGITLPEANAATVSISAGGETVTIRLLCNAPTGVDAIKADADAQTKYFTLHGVEVNQPSSGIFIRKTGRTVSKVILP